jgi:hypothetical protein
MCYTLIGETPARQGLKDSGLSVESLGINIVGLAVSWENRDAYYVSFTHEQPQGLYCTYDNIKVKPLLMNNIKVSTLFMNNLKVSILLMHILEVSYLLMNNLKFSTLLMNHKANSLLMNNLKVCTLLMNHKFST